MRDSLKPQIYPNFDSKQSKGSTHLTKVVHRLKNSEPEPEPEPSEPRLEKV
jgi:hypothetical protein